MTEEYRKQKNMIINDIKNSFNKEINNLKLKIKKERSIIINLDPIEINDDVLYELEIQLIAIENVYNNIFN